MYDHPIFVISNKSLFSKTFYGSYCAMTAYLALQVEVYTGSVSKTQIPHSSESKLFPGSVQEPKPLDRSRNYPKHRRLLQFLLFSSAGKSALSKTSIIHLHFTEEISSSTQTHCCSIPPPNSKIYLSKS